MFNFKSYMKKEIENSSYSDLEKKRIFRTLEEMNRFLGKEESICVYGQNIFLDRDEVRFYAFMKEYLIIGNTGEYNTKIEVLKLDHIDGFEYLIDNETDNLILRLSFKGNKNITLNNNMDTDREHSSRLRDDINRIVNHLLELRV